ncbi:MAG: OsmC family protein [Desulfomonilaceae bacterium]
MKLKLIQTGPRSVEVVSDRWKFLVDLKEEYGGKDQGPNPSELTAAAVASCEMLTGIFWASRRHGVELEHLEAEVEWEYGTKPDRITRFDVKIRGVKDQLGDKTRGFAAMAKACTVTKTFAMPPEMTLEVE